MEHAYQGIFAGARPLDDCKSPSVVELILTREARGVGTERDPQRMVERYHAKSGALVMEWDPLNGETLRSKDMATENAKTEQKYLLLCDEANDLARRLAQSEENTKLAEARANQAERQQRELMIEIEGLRYAHESTRTLLYEARARLSAAHAPVYPACPMTGEAVDQTDRDDEADTMQDAERHDGPEPRA